MSDKDGENLHGGNRDVGLFVTCTVDLFRPSVGWASVRLLEAAGYRVHVPAQSCCGQAAYNNGEPDGARRLALGVVEQFGRFEHVVVPSGSCAGMFRHHYPRLFAGHPRCADVERFASRVYELTAFLVDVAGFEPAAPHDALAGGRVTYHDSCAGLRELGVRSQPRRLLERCAGVTASEMPDTEACCGFGGTFCVKYPEIANRMAADKLAHAHDSGASILLGGDLACLMHLAGTASRLGAEDETAALKIRHVAEALAGDLDTPPIGAPRR